MCTNDIEDSHVLIVGAGTSGLLIAQGLKKVATSPALQNDYMANTTTQANIPFSIFEFETSTTYQMRPREWGMTLHWGSSHIASCLPSELASRFHEAFADPTQDPASAPGLPIYNGKTGEFIMEIAAEKPCRVSRKKMRNLFSEGLDIQYGKKFASTVVEEDGKVKVTFEDGSTATGDVLVGCDGAKSLVRSAIVGTEAAKLTNSSVSMFNFPYKFDAELARRIRTMNPLFINSIHPDHGTMFWLSIQDVPDSSDPSTWTFQVMQSWLDSSVPADVDLSTAGGRISLFKKRAEEWAEPWRSAGRAVDPATVLPLDKGTYWERAARWDNRNGKMTLCGDAAHPMTPHRGQGLNNALQDAANFVAAMQKVYGSSEGQALKHAVDEYDAEVLERGVLEMGISLKQTLFIHDWDTLMQSPMVKMGLRQAEKVTGSTS
jgi:2-polyprenyl-6-methoxyphenol hydroxylase-like FAD-dependent oxidoreductase